MQLLHVLQPKGDLIEQSGSKAELVTSSVAEALKAALGDKKFGGVLERPEVIIIDDPYSSEPTDKKASDSVCW